MVDSQARGSLELAVADELALRQLASRYWALADGTEPVEVGELFTSDGMLELGSLRLEGVDAIAGFFAERERANAEAGRITRHFASGFLAMPRSADEVRVRSTVAVFAGHGEMPIELTLPSGVADFEDLCVRTDSGAWLYRSRIARTVFIGPAAASFAR